MDDGPIANMFFDFAVCKCSHRTLKEEAALGSYCDECWAVIQKHRNCVGCGVPVEQQRLYVDTEYKLPTCKRCFPAKKPYEYRPRPLQDDDEY